MDAELIKLAELMGSPKGGWTNWNPEQNANDDYLILEWMRRRRADGDTTVLHNGGFGEGTMSLFAFADFLMAAWVRYRGISDWCQLPAFLRYKKGDYFRTAVRMIKQERKE